MSSSETELPADVLAALQANRKIEAIKLLRQSSGIGLKEAKDRVDAYIATQPAPVLSRSGHTDTGIGRLVLVCLLGALLYVAYRYFS